ncbi:acyltransferase family protein [Devosia sp. 2618]|uniref:acyltransferase family protein n=1 Tax=Devosia sp. 2618 TaxID=3156454 RepID=UPI0033924827
MNLHEATAVARSKSEALAYQPFVDGLRAISILAVVLYHVGLPGVPGGFVGVDVFFVISGYLIISQIVVGFERGRFSMAGFWARRALRILPPYLLVIVVSLVIAPCVLVMPGEFKDFSDQVIWSAGMVVNQLFVGQGGYFDASADLKPLQHLWSLAVEEQFYVVAPLLIGGLWWVSRRMGGQALRIGVSAVLFVVSLALCVYWTGTGDSTNYAFYLMPLRAWEFIAGGAVGCAVPYLLRLPKPVISALTAVGLAMILGAVALFTAATPFPSFWAVIPALGAALLIAGGVAHPAGLVVRGLTWRPMMWIGLISYAWYLWHWPLLAFMRVYNFGEKVMVWDVAMGALSFVLAIGTHLWIERPIREWRQRTRVQMDWRPVLVGVAACAAVAVSGFGFANFVTPPQLGTYQRTDSILHAGDLCRLNLSDPNDTCPIEVEAQLGVLFGDSHSQIERLLFNTIAHRYGAQIASIGGNRCAPILGVDILNGYPEGCDKIKLDGIAAISSGHYKAQFAILAARWAAYNNNPDQRVGGEDGWALAEPGQDVASDQQKALYIEGLRNSIAALEAAGVKRILVQGPTPEWLRRVPECVTRADAMHLSRDANCALPRAVVEARRANVVAWLKEALSAFPEVRFVDPLDVFCDATMCRPYDGQVLLFSDDDHMSEAGQARVYRAFENDFRWAFGAPGSGPRA